MERTMQRTMRRPVFSAIRGKHDEAFHAVGYSMVYTVEDHGICDGFMAFPMVCRRGMGCLPN